MKGDEAATLGFKVAVGKKCTDKHMNHMKNLEQKSSREDFPWNMQSEKS